MKKNLLLLALSFIALQNVLHAGSISTQTAQTIALNFFKLNVPASGSNLTATLSYTQTETDGTSDFYVFDMAPVTGFVIVAANDNAMPVIAYSKESTFNPYANGNGLSDWMKNTAKKLHYAVTNNIPANAGISYKWTAYLNGINPVNSRATVSVGPLLSTTWNQEPYYNSLCPFNSTDNMHAVTGCVATTMAQIMKYWNYPATGTGSYSYNDAQPAYSNNYGTQSASFAGPFNWAAMPNAVNSNTSPVDTLMYLCGVSVGMDYGDDNEGGSGAFVLQQEAGGGSNPCAQHSYATYFKYNPNTLQGVKFSQYSTADWINLMENELNAGRVIQYEGDDPSSGGHTWVCDGYETNGMLHMNWGWGGSANGYFAVGNLTAGGYTFSQNDGALIGIEPMLPFTLSVTSASPSVCPGGSTTLNASGPVGATYTWTPSTGLSCTTCASPTATPVATTLYKVTADSAGVQATLAMAVVVTQPATAAFSPVAVACCNLPETVTFSNNSTNASSYTWDFGGGTTDIATAPVHGYSADGIYTVKLYATNNCGVDTLIKTNVLTINGGPPTISDENICVGQTVHLTATGLGSINWYNAPVNGGVMANGSGYITPSLTNTTTYYVGNTVTPAVVTAGPTVNTVGSGSYYTRTTKHGMVFNCTVAQKLVSVDVYTDSAGARTILLQDNAGNTLDSTTVTIATGHHTITLNWNVPVATGLQLNSEGFNFMYRNTSGITFPYNTSDASISITGNTSNAPGTFYYFYNWKFQQPACVSTRVPVTVYVLNGDGSTFTATGTGTPTVNFYPADTVATTYAWNFGDGSSSTDKYPVHVYSANGTYTVQLIVSNGTCADTITQSFSTLQLGINEVSTFASLSLYPNPANNQLNLNVTTAQAASNCPLTVRNLLGETVYNNTIQLTAGANNLQLNVAPFASGVYLITLQNGNNAINTRFVKTAE